MPTHRLRRYAFAVLATFIATVCVTLLGPVARPVPYEVLCSANGTRLVATSDDGAVDVHGGSTPGSHGDLFAHCPLCMPAAPPPQVAAWDFTPVQPLAHVRESIASARLASLVGAPLPARGPPVLS